MPPWNGGRPARLHRLRPAPWARGELCHVLCAGRNLKDSTERGVRTRHSCLSALSRRRSYGVLLVTPHRRSPDVGSSPVPGAEGVRQPGLRENWGSLETAELSPESVTWACRMVGGAQLERGSANSRAVAFSGVGSVS